MYISLNLSSHSFFNNIHSLILYSFVFSDSLNLKSISFSNIFINKIISIIGLIILLFSSSLSLISLKLLFCLFMKFSNFFLLIFASCSYKFIFCSFVIELVDIDSLFRLLIF